jgi:hypothetical protein
MMVDVNKQRMIDNQTYAKHIITGYGSNFKYALAIDGV